MDTKLLQDMLDIISASKKLNKAKREFSKVKRNSNFNFSSSIPAKYCAIIDFMRSNKMFDDTTGMEICTELAKTDVEFAHEALKDIISHNSFRYLGELHYMKNATEDMQKTYIDTCFQCVAKDNIMTVINVLYKYFDDAYHNEEYTDYIFQNIKKICEEYFYELLESNKTATAKLSKIIKALGKFMDKDQATALLNVLMIKKNNQLIDDTVLEYCKEADKDIYDKAFAYSTINYMKG